MSNVSSEQLRAECRELVENLTSTELEAAMARAHKLGNDTDSDINRIVGLTAFSILATEFERRKQ